MPESTFHIADAAQARDLKTLISRARTVDDSASVRLQARGQVLAVWVPVMTGETLLDQIPTVLGMRAIHLSTPADVDATVPASAVLDRLARLDKSDGEIVVPPVTTTAPWAGNMPGAGGWAEAGTVTAERIDAVARRGMEAVEQALPENPGGAVLSTVRSRIWGTAEEEGFVAGAAFGATVLGFNDAGADFRMFSNGPWRRLSNPAGHVLARPASAL